MKSAIPVIWWDQGFGNWDSGLLNSIFEKHPTLFQQFNTKELIDVDHAIVIVVGKPEVAPLHSYLNTLKSGTVILTSDEDAFFDFRQAIPAHLEVWTQYWTADRPEIKERLLLGPAGRLKDYKINSDLPKKYLWSFVGQVQNPFRQKCVEILESLPDGFLQVAEYFGGNGKNGMEYQQYLDIMCQSRYVICPAGSMSVDSFRLYEAMECGAIPITDMRAPREPKGFNWWREVCPEANLMMVSSWDNLNANWFKQEFYEERFKMNNWWPSYKERLEKKLLHIATKN